MFFDLQLEELPAHEEIRKLAAGKDDLQQRHDLTFHEIRVGDGCSIKPVDILADDITDIDPYGHWHLLILVVETFKR